MSSPRIKSTTVTQIAQQARLTPTYAVLMGSSGVLAAVAFLANSVPLLVGSMVVAPVLPPLALVAFAVVSGQFRYAGKGLVTAFIGLLLATGCAMATTWLLNITDVFPPEANLLNKPLLEERVRVGWYNVVAALAAGVAGTIALTKDKSDTLVGAVAALALVPAAAAAGIALLSQDSTRAIGGLLLLSINMSVLIVVGVITLWLVRPDKTQ